MGPDYGGRGPGGGPMGHGAEPRGPGPRPDGRDPRQAGDPRRPPSSMPSTMPRSQVSLCKRLNRLSVNFFWSLCTKTFGLGRLLHHTEISLRFILVYRKGRHSYKY